MAFLFWIRHTLPPFRFRRRFAFYSPRRVGFGVSALIKFSSQAATPFNLSFVGNSLSRPVHRKQFISISRDYVPVATVQYFYNSYCILFCSCPNSKKGGINPPFVVFARGIHKIKGYAFLSFSIIVMLSRPKSLEPVLTSFLAVF